MEISFEDTCYAKNIIENVLAQMDCGHQRIFYREVGKLGAKDYQFRCSMCGHINGQNPNLNVQSTPLKKI